MKKKMWVMACAAAVMMLSPVRTVLAEEEAPRNTWINMEQGPGVAQWVDENGTVMEQPGVKEETKPQIQEETGTGILKDQSQENQDSALPQENQEVQDNPAPQENQSSEAPVQETAGRVIDPNRPMVALTFDDGPFAPVGNQIMDCMAQYGGKATFYVVGNRCASYRDEMQRMAAEGHEIGNHTYEHKYLNKLNAEQIQYQINRGSEAIQAASGVAPATVRLPGGNKNATVLENVNAPMIMWSIDTLDWKTKNTQSTIDKVLGSVKDGDVVLMHELYAQTGEAAVQIIPALVERGYQLVTVSEMAQYRGGLQNGRLYSAFRP